MANSPALSTKRPEADGKFEDGSSVVGGGPIVLGGSITNFGEPTRFIPGPAGSLQDQEKIINAEADRNSLEVLNDTVLDAIGAKKTLQK